MTPAVVAKIEKLSREGLSARAIASRLHIGKGSVQNALKKNAGAPKKRADREKRSNGKAPAWTRDESPVGDVTPDHVKTWLAEQVRDQRAIARHAKKSNDVETFQTASRALTASSLLLARIVRQDDKKPEGMFVTQEALEVAAEVAREKLLERVVRRAEKSKRGVR